MTGACKELIGNCLQPHEDCLALQPSVLSTRVVDLRTGNADTLEVVGAESGPVAYAVLSYCLGSGATLTATPQALPELLTGFALSSLPESLRWIENFQEPLHNRSLHQLLVDRCIV